MGVGNNAGDRMQPDAGSQTDFRAQKFEQIKEIVGDNNTGSPEDGAKNALSFIANWENEPKDEDYYDTLTRITNDYQINPTVEDVSNAVLVAEFLYQDELSLKANRPADILPDSWKSWGETVDMIKFHIGATVEDMSDDKVEGVETVFDSDGNKYMFVDLLDGRTLEVRDYIEYDLHLKEVQIVSPENREKDSRNRIDEEQGRALQKKLIDDYSISEFL